jgi:hypothetical protein
MRSNWLPLCLTKGLSSYCSNMEQMLRLLKGPMIGTLERNSRTVDTDQSRILSRMRNHGHKSQPYPPITRCGSQCQFLTTRRRFGRICWDRLWWPTACVYLEGPVSLLIDRGADVNAPSRKHFGLFGFLSLVALH